MAAYAAVISLKQTIKALVNSCLFSTPEILEFAYNHTTSLQQLLESFNDSSSSSSKRVEGQIRDCAHKLEDAIEFYELQSQLDQSEVVRQEINSFVETVKMIEVEYTEELSKPITQNDDVATHVDVEMEMEMEMEMVGRSDELNSTRDLLVGKMRPNDLCFFSFFGGNGSGRTMAANTIFKHLRNRKGGEEIFECCAWVTVGTKYQIKEVLIRILAQLDNLAADDDYISLLSREEEKLCSYLYRALQHRRYMIVVDSVDDVKVVEYLRRSLPDESNGSLLILTTRSKEVTELADSFHTFELPAAYLEEMLWFSLLPILNFGIEFESIPLELEEAGKKIIHNCGGLFIAAAKTLLFLTKTDHSLQQWCKIAADKQNPIFIVADEISEVAQIKIEMQSHSCDMDEERRKVMVELISTYVDLPHFVENIKMKMHPERFFSKTQILSLLGMAGIGKTTFAMKIFTDESIFCHFDHHVWITLGSKYQTEEILIDILAQIYPGIDKLHIKADEKLARDLCLQLFCKRCLIVLDDLWSKEPLHHLKNVFPDIKGTILVTTRIAKVAKFGGCDAHFEMQLLDKEQSWCLLHQKVFAEGLCPPELEKVGRKIAEKCEGLPLLILTVANQLLKVEMSQEYWNSVASGKQKSVFMNAHHEISEALLPSYESLPQHLKACFLYVGVFREKYEIHTSKLSNLWIAEGFLEPNSSSQMLEDFVAECLSELVDQSLVMVQRKASDFQIKTCRLHAVFWHLSNSEAVKNNFFYAMNSYDDCSIESMKGHRRLCIRNSVLLGMKNVQNSMATMTTAHSLLCVSPLHQYPVPLNFDLRLLRVMNALTIRLYEFPVEVVKLVHLRYLGLTCNGELPTSISNLWKLQYLIVKRYMNIKSSKNSWPLPPEIWDMKELKHLQVMGGCLPNPKCGAGLPKLSTLLDVSAQSCTQEVLEMIPNLKRLGIRIELAPNDEDKSFLYLNNISRLCGLESLKCVVVNPQIRCEVIPSMFPPSLKKLSLSGTGYPWEHMSMIGKLENLEVLKLKKYAFQGEKWELDYSSQFSKLKYLLIEDTNLVQWKFNSPVATKLERIYIKHCYKLQELPIALPLGCFTNVEIVDCNPKTVTWAELVQEVTTNCQVKVHFSWIADK